MVGLGQARWREHLSRGQRHLGIRPGLGQARIEASLGALAAKAASRRMAAKTSPPMPWSTVSKTA